MPKILSAFRGTPGFQGTQFVKDSPNYMMWKKLLQIISKYNQGTRLEGMEAN